MGAADAEAREKMAQAEANSIRILAEAKAKALEIEAKAKANAEMELRKAAAFVPEHGDNKHAHQMALMKNFAQVTKGLGDKTVILDAKSEFGKTLGLLSTAALTRATAQ